MKKLFCICLLAAMPLAAAVDKKNLWRGWVQPYPGVVITLDGKPVAPRLIKRDNTMALVELPLPSGSAELVFAAPDYSPRTVEALPYIGGDLPLVALDRAASSLSLYKYYRTGSQPKSVRFIDKDRIVLPLLDAPGIDVIDIHSGARSRIAPPEHAAKNGFVESLVVPERNELWVSQMTTNTAYAFSLNDLAFKGGVKVSGSWGKVLAWDPVSRQVIFSNWNGRNVSIIDPETMRETASFPAGGFPRGLVLSDDASRLYVCQYGKNTDADARGRLAVIDMKTRTIMKEFANPGAKRHILRDAARKLILVSDMARAWIELYDEDSLKLIKTIPVFSHPNTIALSPDGKFLYVSCRGPNNPKSYYLKGLQMGRLLIIDMETQAVAESIEGGNQCTGLDVSPDGTHIVLTDFLDNAVRVYRRRGN